MSTTTRERLHQMVENLPENTLQAVQRILERIAQRNAVIEFNRELLRDGALLNVTPDPTDEIVRRFHEWKPIPVTGESVSNTIIEDRNAR
ncbi:MAG: hypothetical protein O3A46_04745 [Candidatus Poribacteria bacterium]|nr:hypothetical protein [Candidatus Poribacteria bacterium]